MKDIKQKSHTSDVFLEGTEHSDKFNALNNPKVDFTYKNIIPIPNLLMKPFFEFTKTDPITIAVTFFEMTCAYNSTLGDSTPKYSRKLIDPGHENSSDEAS
jgi:hypothetical protein